MSLLTRPFAHLDKVIAIAQEGPNVASWERNASLIGGAVAAASAVYVRSPAAILLGILGVGLLYRGATGRCELYRKLGINTAQPGLGAPPATPSGIAVPPLPETGKI